MICELTDKAVSMAGQRDRWIDVWMSQAVNPNWVNGKFHLRIYINL